ncbi:probable phospholipid-transporting ATPase VD isoform X1 [Python bivittatus]|uniref:Phospholipid-transporting ATPase n=1 Tax=Python bivittatus TaxID=176946 RepID=A0A9F2WIB9_PYTBI|nr:probable phospholipid-transporting ATPase VD isoform X1 [Python bivittatus]XP_025030057.1 probable phospholipid-transporting ATPase VD isoform X1 [Python bivittatus]
MAERWWGARHCWRWLKSAMCRQNSIRPGAPSCDTLLPPEKPKKHRVVIPWPTHFKEEYKKVSNLYRNNNIRTTKYRFWSFIPRNLFEQFHRAANLYFLFIVLLNWVPVVEAFRKEITMIPLCVVLTIIAVKDGLEDYTKYKLDKKINNLVTSAYSRREKDYVDKFWKDVTVGDFIRLSCNEEIPADMILIYSTDGDGICHIETSSLDGETNLKQKQVVKGFAEQVNEVNPEDIICRIECESPNNDLNSFRGFIENTEQERVGLNKDNLLMRGCTVRNTETVVGIVVYAGHETKAMLNTTGARYKRSKLEKRMNGDILWCVLLLIVMCFTGAIGHGLWLSAHTVPPLYTSGKQPPAGLGGFLMFWTMIILLQVLIPISVYVSIEFVKLGHIFLIKHDIDLYDETSDRKIQCGSLNIAEDLGQIEYIFSDKTGTLTENKMVFRRCSIAGLEYGHEEHAKRLETYQDYETDEDDGAFFSSHCSLKHPSRAKFFGRKSSGFLSSRVFHSTSTMGLGGWRQLAFSSPLETDVVPDMRLVKKVNHISFKAYSYTENLRSIPEIVYITEFFIALAICNTVVVSTPDQPRLKRRWSSMVRMPALNLGEFKNIFQRLSSIRRMSPQSSGSSGGHFESPKRAGRLSVHVKFPSSLPVQLSDSLEMQGLSPGQKMPDTLSAPDDRREELLCESLNATEICYEAESPDEAALVHAARAYQCTLKARSPEQVQIDFGPLGTLTFQLLHILPFDSIRKRMSVVVKHPILNKVVVYTKGADAAIMNLLDMELTGNKKIGMQKNAVKAKTQKHLNDYATKGLRTLCISMKVLSDEEYEEWLKGQYAAESSIECREQLLLESAERLEDKLTLLGASGIEDRLQEGVPETIEALRKAGINIWMLTGDKRETAINIAYSCKLLDVSDRLFTLEVDSLEACASMVKNILEEINRMIHTKKRRNPSGTEMSTSSFALIINGPTLEFALHKKVQRAFMQLAARVRAVICCRATPLQKSKMVKHVQTELQVMTLAIGDGANDVSMIQVANIGIGISGQEGMQAVLASDFAISQFRHLKKLLFVHGHWCYTRLADMILYFFYKNVAYVNLLFWYQFYCGFSGTPMIDYWSLIFFNLLFTSVPPVIYGVLDKDVSAETLMNNPELYKASQKNEPYVGVAFAMNLVDAFYQSLVCFFICYFTFRGSDVDVYSFGNPMNTTMFFIILLHLLIESKNVNIIHFSVFAGSIFLYFFVLGLLGAFCVLCNPPANPYWIIQRQLVNPMFYLVCMISITLALLPRYLFRVIQTTVFPSPLIQARILEQQSRVR